MAYAAAVPVPEGVTKGVVRLMDELELLTSELTATREELARISERQQFVEALLEERGPRVLPPA